MRVIVTLNGAADDDDDDHHNDDCKGPFNGFNFCFNMRSTLC